MTKVGKIKEQIFDKCLSILQERKDCKTAYDLIMQAKVTEQLKQETKGSFYAKARLSNKLSRYALSRQ